MTERHRTRAELDAALPFIRSAPSDGGEVRLIVARPEVGERIVLASALISADGGVQEDHWAKGCWKTLEDGRPHPDVQICIMGARAIESIAGPMANWPPAGDNIFLDMDLSPQNLPPGTQLAIGGAIVEITEERHRGCDKFITRYGRDACVFANTGEGDDIRIRGIYARVCRDGIISQGDTAKKV